MALEILNNAATAAYREAVKPVQKLDIETQNAQSSVQTTGTVFPSNTKQTMAVQNGETDRQQNQEAQQNQDTNAQKIKNALNNANIKMKHAKTRCEFSYHEETKRISIKVVDKETDEIVREIPPEETLEMVEKLWELAGIMIDEKR